MFADQGLNPQALAIETAQEKIRLAVKEGFLRAQTWTQIERRVTEIIRKTLRRVEIPALRAAATRGLIVFARTQYRLWMRNFGSASVLVALLALSGIARGMTAERAQTLLLTRPRYRALALESYQTTEAGIPMQIYAETYARHVREALDEIAARNALDPDDASGRNSLRNRAEMEVRYRAHLDRIAALRSQGVRLAVCSTHADCSDRCYPWQGRVYSLDGSYGRTESGLAYVPLEKATDVYYVTRAGAVYKNGLLGFNCRHALYPYRDGTVIPHVSREEQQRQSKINARQRRMEGTVRELRAKATIYAGLDERRAQECRKRAQAAYEAYKRFSHQHGRAYYPSRTKL